MNNEQLAFAKTIMTRTVTEKIPEAKRWSVSKEFKSWIDSLSKEQFQMYLDRLRLLTRSLSDEGPADHEVSKETGQSISFGSYLPAESQKIEQLARIGGEAAAYYALALWRSLQVEELQRALSGNKPDLPETI